MIRLIAPAGVSAAYLAEVGSRELAYQEEVLLLNPALRYEGIDRTGAIPIVHTEVVV